MLRTFLRWAVAACVWYIPWTRTVVARGHPASEPSSHPAILSASLAGIVAARESWVRWSRHVEKKKRRERGNLMPPNWVPLRGTPPHHVRQPYCLPRAPRDTPSPAPLGSEHLLDGPTGNLPFQVHRPGYIVSDGVCWACSWNGPGISWPITSSGAQPASEPDSVSSRPRAAWSCVASHTTASLCYPGMPGT